MTRVPPPFLRGLTVFGLGAALVVSHVSFAAAGAVPLSSSATGKALAKAGAGPLAENCYFDSWVEVTASGKRIVRRVQECD